MATASFSVEESSETQEAENNSTELPETFSEVSSRHILLSSIAVVVETKIRQSLVQNSFLYIAVL